MMKKILVILFLVIIASIVFVMNKEEEIEIHKDVEERKKQEEEEEIDLSPTGEYREDVVVIDGQPMYYAYPELRNNSPKPTLVVYSHGQLQRITQNLEEAYMLKIREYGEFFASKGYAFSASNQHDDNWGQAESLRDIALSIEWFTENNLPIQNQVHMIGFSMGGLAPVNYAIENPEYIKSITLLAPTPKNNLNRDSVEILTEIPIKIWHGTADINIPFTASQQYISVFETLGKEVELIPIENAQHYDVETSLMEEILEFFED